MLMSKYNFKSALHNSEYILQKGNVKSPHPVILALLAVSVSPPCAACDDYAVSRSVYTLTVSNEDQSVKPALGYFVMDRFK